MLIQDKYFQLKDGRTALLRSPREEDASELLQIMKTASAETDFLSRYPEEWSLTEEQEREWVRNVRDGKHVCPIVCEVEGQLAGNCEVRFYTDLTMRHRGTVGIALVKEYWGLGIGTAMFEKMIEIARLLKIIHREGQHVGHSVDSPVFTVDGLHLLAAGEKDIHLRLVGAVLEIEGFQNDRLRSLLKIK